MTTFEDPLGRMTRQNGVAEPSSSLISLGCRRIKPIKVTMIILTNLIGKIVEETVPFIQSILQYFSSMKNIQTYESKNN